MSDPRLSIVVPFYNAEATLVRALRSALASELRDIEIVLVNDGSTDAGEMALAPFLNDPRVRLLRQDNRGINDARAAGVNAARAPLCCFLDADDEMMPGRASLLVDTAERLPERAVLTTGSEYITEDGEMQTRAIARSLPLLSDITEAFCNASLRPNGATMCLRRDYLLALGNFDTTFHHGEEEFFSRFIADGARVWHLNLPLYRVYLSRNSDRWRPGHRAEELSRLLALFEERIAQHEGTKIGGMIRDLARARMFNSLAVAFRFDPKTRNALITPWQGRSWLAARDRVLARLLLAISKAGLSQNGGLFLHLSVRRLRWLIFSIAHLSFRFRTVGKTKPSLREEKRGAPDNE